MPEGEIYSEKRKFKRAEKKLEVSYKIVSLPNEIEEIKKKTEKKITETVNISVGGVQLIEDEELAPDQILRMEFKLEGRDPVITFAEVRWSAMDSNIGKHRAGIEFLVLKEDDKKVIEELIDGE